MCVRVRVLWESIDKDKSVACPFGEVTVLVSSQWHRGCKRAAHWSHSPSYTIPSALSLTNTPLFLSHSIGGDIALCCGAVGRKSIDGCSLLQSFTLLDFIIIEKYYCRSSHFPTLWYNNRVNAFRCQNNNTNLNSNCYDLVIVIS